MKSKILILTILLSAKSFTSEKECEASQKYKLRSTLSSILGNLKIQEALEIAAKNTNTIIIGRKINPQAYSMLYEGAIGKPMNIKAKSSLRKNLVGTIPKNQYLSKNLKKLTKIDHEISQLSEGGNKKIELLIAKKEKILNTDQFIGIPLVREGKTLVYKEGVKGSDGVITEYVKDPKGRKVVKVLGDKNSDGELAYYTADLDLYALLEFKHSRLRNKFVKNLGFVSETMPDLIKSIKNSFDSVGFLPSCNIVNHGDEMGYGKNVTPEMLKTSDKGIFPMHAVGTERNYIIIKKFNQLKKIFIDAKKAGYGVDGWSKDAFPQRDAIFDKR